MYSRGPDKQTALELMRELAQAAAASYEEEKALGTYPFYDEDEQRARAKAAAETKPVSRAERRRQAEISQLATIVKHFLDVPSAFTNLWRYEIALRGSLLRTFHELQRIQAARAGHRVPVPAALDLNLNVGGEMN